MTDTQFPLPATEHDRSIPVSAIESRARNASNTWASVPVNDQDLSQGFKDISFWQFNNYANHAAHWLNQNLPQTSEEFQSFAYAGPKDLRYSFLEVAAAKLQKVMVVPSPLVTAEAQLRILNAKQCAVYLRPLSMASQIDSILRDAPHVQTVTVPDIEEFMLETEAPSYTYPKTWDEGKDDPWLVFHTSGTTGNPKPLTFTHRSLDLFNLRAASPDIEPGLVHQWAQSRWYTPLPSLHMVGTMMALPATTFLGIVMVVGPATPPTPRSVLDVLRYGKVEGAVLPPAIIEELCLSPEGREGLRNLKYIQFAGAPLSAKAAEQLIDKANIIPAIGSTETGPYPTVIHDKRDAWQYVGFQKHAGVEFEPYANDMYELVYVKRPGCVLQPVFLIYPHLDRFETKDLWQEHPVHKGLWKIVGRKDDMVSFSHGESVHASLLEPEIESHPDVKSALIGGHGRPAPVLLVEFFPEAVAGKDNAQLRASLQPYIDKVNLRCHDCVQLSLDRVIVATSEKPFVRTIKGNPTRMPTLDLYRDQIAALFG